MIAAWQANFAYLDILRAGQLSPRDSARAQGQDLALQGRLLDRAAGWLYLARSWSETESAMYGAGLVTLMSGDPSQSDLKNTGKLSQIRVKTLTLLTGLAAYKQGQPALAMSIWSAGPDAWEFSSYLVNVGDVRLRSGDHYGALSFYTAANELTPSLAAQLRLVRAAQAASDTQLADAWIARSLAVYGSDAFIDVATKLDSLFFELGFHWVLISAADSLVVQDKTADAERLLSAAAGIRPEPVTFYPFGSFLCRQGEFSRGQDVLAQSRPYGNQLYALLSRREAVLCACKAGSKDRALLESSELVRIAPNEQEFVELDRQLREDWDGVCAPSR